MTCAHCHQPLCACPDHDWSPAHPLRPPHARTQPAFERRRGALPHAAAAGSVEESDRFHRSFR